MFHAVLSEWRSIARQNKWKDHGELTLNFGFLGIEFYSPDYAKTPQKDVYNFEIPGTYTQQQLQKGVAFIKKQLKIYNIDPKNVVAHSDVEPYRYTEDGSPTIHKTDPHINFPWKKSGLGVWPKETKQNSHPVKKDIKTIKNYLIKVGYEINRCGITREDSRGFSFELKACAIAFARHWDNNSLENMKQWSGSENQVPDSFIIRLENLANGNYMNEKERKL